MEAQEVKSKINETIAEKPVFIKLDIKPRNKLHEWLMRKGWVKSDVVYELKPLLIANMFRIIGKLERIPEIDFDASVQDVVFKTIGGHYNDILYVLAVGVQNNRNEPERALIKELENNISAKDAFTIFKVILGKFDMENFFNSIVLMKGINGLQQTSQNGERE